MVTRDFAVQAATTLHSRRNWRTAWIKTKHFIGDLISKTSILSEMIPFFGASGSSYQIHDGTDVEEDMAGSL
jgi:hypothetical protein